MRHYLELIYGKTINKGKEVVSSLQDHNPDTDLGHILSTHVLLLTAVAVTGQPAALPGLAGAVVAALRVDTEVLAGPVPIVRDAG